MAGVKDHNSYLPLYLITLLFHIFLFFSQGEIGEPGQKGSKGDKGEQVSLYIVFCLIHLPLPAYSGYK